MSEPPITSRPRRRGRRLRIAILIALALLVAVELFCRLYLGLGDPPLSMADPEIEYLFKPSMTYHRFGNLVRYNAYSMRSDDFPAHKASADELRVVVLGDSVVNGGALTDQSQLATTILQRELSRDLKRPVIVGNISAGSWGPPNLLAYVKRFGLFDADIVVLVFNSADYGDVPTFEPIVDIDPNMPGHAPWCATWEAITRYLPQYLPGGHAHANTAPPRVPTTQEVGACQDAIRQVIRIARQGKARVVVALYPSQREVGKPLPDGHQAIAAAARDAGVEPINLEPAFNAAVQSGINPYRDYIHPDAAGQQVLAESLRAAIREAMKQP